MNGKWKFTETYVQVYCRNCWASGIIARRGDETNDEIAERAAKLHTRCKSPDIRATTLKKGPKTK